MSQNLYYFNPTCELAVANGSAYYTAPEKLRLFEQELSCLPAYLAQPNDIILVPEHIPHDFLESIMEVGFIMPKFMTMDDLISFSDCEGKKIDRLFPWGWSPAAHHFLSPLKSFCSISFLQSAVSSWKPIHRELYGRKAGLAILKSVIGLTNYDWLPSVDEIPTICESHDEIIRFQEKWKQIVVKAPWSSSGKGLQVLRDKEYNRTNRQIISGMLKQQGFVTVGPWHKKLIDLSFQFFSYGNGQIEYKGLTSFSTDHLGRYLGNYIEEIPRNLDRDLLDFLLDKKEKVKKLLSDVLDNSAYATDYYGWFGVDAIIFRSESGDLVFHPCIEINCRFTMGAITLNLRNHILESSTGKFMIYRGEQGLFSDFCNKMNHEHSLEVFGKKINHGFLPLTPFGKETKFGAYMMVKNEFS
jgi:hypothetical protein